ncbi:hypothetical protein [Coconut foliar decay alphasatellite 4]|uniref:Uncharacterized protein n=1 Tax=Coconut foliar decay alphasatellite 4 TaxID=2161877 RepID=A0A2R4N9F2_9VIRU|nr:hypothetical protein KM708_gp4 [Coconut foliar decay alphasatellite 4]AVX29428.1 hypothetical protein [Coconut foliar decay alphasatellite 4]AVX29463.1 hypothetical protein [Coconut foliar decay alphasatellite 4]
MTGSTSNRHTAPTNKIECTVRRRRPSSNTASRLVLESRDDWSIDLMMSLMNSAWKTQADTEGALHSELQWNGLDGPLRIHSHSHITIGSLSCCLKSKSKLTTAPFYGYADEPEERANPCSRSSSDSSPTGSTHVVEPGKMCCTSTSRSQKEM